jgi:hypothetical protein
MQSGHSRARCGPLAVLRDGCVMTLFATSAVSERSSCPGSRNVAARASAGGVPGLLVSPAVELNGGAFTGFA